MGTFCSETSANRHNSGKFEILIALQIDLIWLFLHFWFSKFPRGGPLDHPTGDTRGNLGSHFFIQPLCHAATPTSLSSAHTYIKTLFAMHLM